MKTCRKCNIEKSEDAFYKNSKVRGGLHSSCIECDKAISKKHYWADPIKERKRSNKYYVLTKEKHKEKYKEEMMQNLLLRASVIG